MRVKLNSIEITVESCTVAQLLEQQGVETKGIAVAINRRVVPRSQWSERELSDNDEVVVVSAVYGG